MNIGLKKNKNYILAQGGLQIIITRPPKSSKLLFKCHHSIFLSHANFEKLFKKREKLLSSARNHQRRYEKILFVVILNAILPEQYKNSNYSFPFMCLLTKCLSISMLTSQYNSVLLNTYIDSISQYHYVKVQIEFFSTQSLRFPICTMLEEKQSSGLHPWA